MAISEVFKNGESLGHLTEVDHTSLFSQVFFPLQFQIEVSVTTLPEFVAKSIWSFAGYWRNPDVVTTSAKRQQLATAVRVMSTQEHDVLTSRSSLLIF